MLICIQKKLQNIQIYQNTIEKGIKEPFKFTYSLEKASFLSMSRL